MNAFKLKGNNKDYSLEYETMMVGSCPNADIYLNNENVAFYQALLVVKDSGVLIKNLSHPHSLLINGQMQKEGYVGVGDTLIIGGTVFTLEESTENFKSIKRDSAIEKDEDITLPLLPSDLSNDLILIDDEYCDLEISQKYKTVESTPLSLTFDWSEFCEFEEKKKTYNLFEEKETKSRLELTILIDGNVVGMREVKMKNGQYFFGPISNKTKKNQIPLPGIDAEVVAFEIENGNIKIINEEITSSFKEINEDQLFDHSAILTFRGIQLVFTTVRNKISKKPFSFWNRDKKQQQYIMSIALALFIPFLTLKLIDTTIEEEQKKDDIVIVYKMKKSDQNLEQKEEGASQQAAETPEVAKENMNQKVAEKKPTQEKKQDIQKNQPKKLNPVKKMANSRPVKKPVKKAYKLKINTSFSKVFSKASSLDSAAKAQSRGIASVQSSNFPSGAKSSRTGRKGTVSKIGAGYLKGANLNKGTGISGKGKYKVSTLSSRTDTVILGSIDPDLLRKILREYLPQFKYCYQQELQKDESTQGILNLKFRITKFGKASNIKVLSKKSRFSRSGSSCMASVLKRIPFPKPKGGGVVDVKQPLNFSSEKHKI